ncbi:signal peptidase I [Neisseria sp. Ec49-e6-T10]|uniref:signal peptidase I n=1 Tax=Neisseria sp. Ec49-e6-T10 TaxID=3140744 RepID=UPI003EB9D537
MAAIGALIVGAILFFISDKSRKEGQEWSSNLQWGYLLMMVGVFGVLSKFFSFTAVLLIFVVFTGATWVYDKVLFRAYKKQQQTAEQTASYSAGHFVDYMRGFFSIILIVFVLRSFVVEPFQIPSSSMRPGLIVGDFILVNKFSYGIRVPILNKVMIPTGSIQRGDVVVFNYPEQPSLNYIKRIVALPGDIIEYRDKVLKINGQTVVDQPIGQASYTEQTLNGTVSIENKVFKENLDKKEYDIFQIQDAPTLSLGQVRSNFPFRDNCQYALSGFICKVPEGNYFAMGDNRDNSLDSRYWGFVDDQLIVGKAFLVWMNFSDFARIGTTIK